MEWERPRASQCSGTSWQRGLDSPDFARRLSGTQAVTTVRWWPLGDEKSAAQLGCSLYLISCGEWGHLGSGRGRCQQILTVLAWRVNRYLPQAVIDWQPGSARFPWGHAQHRQRGATVEASLTNTTTTNHSLGTGSLQRGDESLPPLPLECKDTDCILSSRTSFHHPFEMYFTPAHKNMRQNVHRCAACLYSPTKREQHHTNE